MELVTLFVDSICCLQFHMETILSVLSFLLQYEKIISTERIYTYLGEIALA